MEHSQDTMLVHFVGLGVAHQGAVAVNGLNGASGANAKNLHAEAVSHGVGFGEAQDLVAHVLEVSNTSQGQVEALGGSHSLIKALGFVVVGVDVLGTSVGLKGSRWSGQPDARACRYRPWSKVSAPTVKMPLV